MTDITHPALVKALVKPGAEIAANMTPADADLWHGATGVAGETTEVLDAVIMAVLMGGQLDRVNMVEELGDIEFYMEQVRTNLGVDYNDTLIYLHRRPILDLFQEAALLAISGGSLLDAAKKVAIYKKAVEVLDFVAILASIEQTLESIRNIVGITREETLVGNIAKLSVRYAGLTYTNEAAQTRADKE